MLSGSKLDFKMNMKFDHRHYVAVLRWKRAERIALRELGNEARGRITPLLKLVPTADYSPSKVSNDVKSHWGPWPFLLDFTYLPESGNHDFVLMMHAHLRSHALLAIPVVGLSIGRGYESAVAKIIGFDKHGVCIRLYPEDLQGRSLKAYLDRLLDRLTVAPDQVDLVADYRIISEFSMP